nr:aldolase [Paenibacillus humicola]
MKQPALNVYKAFGLRLASEIALPEALREPDQAGGPDVRIEWEDLKALWDERKQESDYYAVHGDEFMMHIPGTAIFRVQGGKRIGVSPDEGAEETGIRLYVLGSCMGAILLQRKLFPLHGSAVVIDGKAYAIVGDSGAGKSTLAAALGKLGYPLLTDDVIAVSAAEDGSPVVIPAYPQQKLWQESLDMLGMQDGEYAPLYMTKYAVPLSTGFYGSPVPLAGIFELKKTELEGTDMRLLDGLERLPAIRYHTYRHFLVSLFGLDQWHFGVSVSIVNHVRMYQLARPALGVTVHDLVTRILSETGQNVKILHG